MIDKQEIMDSARVFGLAAQVVEKDYTLGWMLAGIAAHPEIGSSWAFKGGTCLKKCYFETYRFSEDLDFTLTNPEHLDETFLTNTFREIAEWVYDHTGIEIPDTTIKFEVYQNPRGGNSAQGKVGYQGPMQRRGDAPRIKLDLTDDEILVLEPVMRGVHHPYSDKPENGIQVLCYSFEEVFAEKMRALGERERPRDLYDVVHLYRHDGISPDPALIYSTLTEKCQFKNIAVPTMSSLSNQPARAELEADWHQMLAHQLPTLPPFEQFWNELSNVFEWLLQKQEKTILASVPTIGATGTPWNPTHLPQAGYKNLALEAIRFAAANRLCVDLQYDNKNRLIEPYSLRKTQDGNILLHATRHDTGEARSYRIDKIQGATVTQTSFIPKYAVELMDSGTIHVPQAR